MKQGRLAADGPKETLLTAATLSSLFEVQLEVSERDGYFHTW